MILINITMRITILIIRKYCNDNGSICILPVEVRVVLRVWRMSLRARSRAGRARGRIAISIRRRSSRKKDILIIGLFVSYLLQYMLCRAPRIGVGGRPSQTVAHRVK